MHCTNDAGGIALDRTLKGGATFVDVYILSFKTALANYKFDFFINYRLTVFNGA